MSIITSIMFANVENESTIKQVKQLEEIVKRCTAKLKIK